MSPPRLVVPAGLAPVDSAPVALPEGSPARRVARVEGRATDGARFVAECFAARVPGWSASLRVPVEGRTLGMLGVTAERRLGRGVLVQREARASGESGAALVAADDGAPLGEGRLLLAFDGREVHSCFAACLGSPAPVCRAALTGAALEGGTAPPPRGLALSLAEGVAGHPRAAAGALLGALALGAMVGVLSRRRPRTRP